LVGPRLQHINLALCEKITDEGLDQLIKNCPNLKFIDISGNDHLSDRTTKNIQKNSLHLKTLDLSRTFRFSEESLFDVVTACKNLTLLRLRALDEEPRFSKELFEKIAKERPTLTILKNY